MNSAVVIPQDATYQTSPTSMSQKDVLGRYGATDGMSKFYPGESSHGSLKWDSRSGNLCVRTTRTKFDTSITMQGTGTVKKITRKATIEASPDRHRQGSKGQSRCKSPADFESVASGLAKSIEQQVLNKKMKGLTKEWAEQRNQLKGQIKRLQFIVRQWELLDKQAQNQTKAKQTVGESAPTPCGSSPEPSSKLPQQMTPDQEVKRLQALLKQTEVERNQVMKDMHHMQLELKKIKWMPNQTPRFFREDNHPTSHNTLNISEGPRSQRTHAIPRSHLGKPPIRRQSETQQLHSHYQRLISDKDYEIEMQQRQLTSLQEELQQERHDTITLLERRTCELRKEMDVQRQNHDAATSQLKSAIDRLNAELEQEQNKAISYQNSLSLKTELVQYLEGQILSLSHAIRRKEQKQHPQISSVEAFNLVDTSFGSKAKSTTSNGIQTDLPMLRRNDEAVQVNTATLERVGSSKNLNEMERLSRKLLEMSQQLQEKDRLISSLSGGASDAEHTKQIERICNEMVQENTRLKTLILEGAVPDSKSTDDTRIRIITKDISKCDLSAITNPLLVREISELRLFRAAASKELQRLKNELAESRSVSEVNWSEKDMQKSQLSSQQDRLLRNSYEVAISNLNSQMNGLRTKLEGLQLRYDIKCRELKEKDAFVRNVIVTRVGRDANTSDLQYFSHKLDEFMASPRSLGRN